MAGIQGNNEVGHQVCEEAVTRVKWPQSTLLAFLYGERQHCGSSFVSGLLKNVCSVFFEHQLRGKTSMALGTLLFTPPLPVVDICCRLKLEHYLELCPQITNEKCVSRYLCK